MPSHRNVWACDSALAGIEIASTRPSLTPAEPLRQASAKHDIRVHAAGVSGAYRRAITDPRAVGAYNVAANPVLDLPTIEPARRARAVRLPRGIARRPSQRHTRLVCTRASQAGSSDIPEGEPRVLRAKITIFR